MKNRFIVARTEHQIDEVLDKCAEVIDGERRSPFWGMSYEDGITAAINWLIDPDQPNPLEE